MRAQITHSYLSGAERIDLSDTSEMIHQLSTTAQFLKIMGGTHLLRLLTLPVYKIGTHF